ENWDGSGYPDGLRGEAIPIGARILQIVDCFDALTSDRPYRRRLTAADALNILRTRRGHMYDPALVDAYVAMRTSEQQEEEDQAPRQAMPDASHRAGDRRYEGSVPHHLDRMTLVCSLARQLSAAATATDAGQQACAAGAVIFGGTGVFYLYDRSI